MGTKLKHLNLFVGGQCDTIQEAVRSKRTCQLTFSTEDVVHLIHVAPFGVCRAIIEHSTAALNIIHLIKSL